MSDEERTDPAADADAARTDPEAQVEEDEDGSSPFDHPAFLPVLLWALAVWFGYDGWINQDPDMLEHVTFNRVGFGVLALAATYYTAQAIRERRADDGSPEAGAPGD